jgi:hypothetical protein
MVNIPSEPKRVQFYSVVFPVLVVVLGTFSLETAAVGSQTVYAKKHTATAQVQTFKPK